MSFEVKRTGDARRQEASRIIGSRISEHIGCTWESMLLAEWTNYTVRRLYFATLEVRFILSLTFQKLSLAFNLGYLSQVFINFNNQWQFWNPHDKQISNLSLIFEFAEELTEIIDNEKDEDEINFWKISTVFNLKYLNQNFIKLSM